MSQPYNASFLLVCWQVSLLSCTSFSFSMWLVQPVYIKLYLIQNHEVWKWMYKRCNVLPSKWASRCKRKRCGVLQMKRRCESQACFFWRKSFWKRRGWGWLLFHHKWWSAITMVFLRVRANTRLGFIVNPEHVFFSLDSAPVFTEKVSELKGPCQDSALNHIIQQERTSQDS